MADGIFFLVWIIIVATVLQSLWRFFTDRPGRSVRPPAGPWVPPPARQGLEPTQGRDSRRGPQHVPTQGPRPVEPDEAAQPHQPLRRPTPVPGQGDPGWPGMDEVASPWGDLARRLGELLGDFEGWGRLQGAPRQRTPGSPPGTAGPAAGPAGSRSPASPAVGGRVRAPEPPSREGTAGSEGTAGTDEGWSVEGRFAPRGAAAALAAPDGESAAGVHAADGTGSRPFPPMGISVDWRTAWQWAEILSAPRALRPWRPTGRPRPEP